MLNEEAKNSALKAHKKAVKKYNESVETVQKRCRQLYDLRRKTIANIKVCENLINSIAGTPKDFNAKMVKIETGRVEFHETEVYTQEALRDAVKAGVDIAAGIGSAAAIAAAAPTAAMWVATTFGTASTGTAIASLSGAAATKAALAWLGGGALAAGGAGAAGGQALLALAGPIGWGIAAAAVGGNVLFLSIKNEKIAREAIDEAKAITIAGAQLNETCAVISHLCEETQMLLQLMEGQLAELRSLRNRNYGELTSDQQIALGALVNNTLSLAEMLNKTVGRAGRN